MPLFSLPSSKPSHPTILLRQTLDKELRSVGVTPVPALQNLPLMTGVPLLTGVTHLSPAQQSEGFRGWLWHVGTQVFTNRKVLVLSEGGREKE